jgi:hypothetical protein
MYTFYKVIISSNDELKTFILVLKIYIGAAWISFLFKRN